MSGNESGTGAELVVIASRALALVFNTLLLVAFIVFSTWKYFPTEFNDTIDFVFEKEIFDLTDMPSFINDKHLDADVIILIIVIHSFNILVIYFNKKSKLFLSTIITIFLYVLLLLFRTNQNLLIAELITSILNIILFVLGQNINKQAGFSMSASMMDRYDQQL